MASNSDPTLSVIDPEVVPVDVEQEIPVHRPFLFLQAPGGQDLCMMLEMVKQQAQRKGRRIRQIHYSTVGGVSTVKTHGLDINGMREQVAITAVVTALLEMADAE